jgi:lipopolysaccharide transport system permease protein
VPYPLLVFAGLLPWQFFTTALTDASNSLVGGSELISKVYFPRLIVPVSATVVSLVDLLISGVVLLGLFAWYDFLPNWRMLAVPFLIALTAALAIGAGLWFAALTVKYRDFRYVLALLLQVALYISPVGFSAHIIPEKWQLLYALNPMVGVIYGFRWSLLRGEPPLFVPALAISIAVAILLLVTGIRYFRATERRFADVI